MVLNEKITVYFLIIFFYFLLCQNLSKNRVSDADRQKRISNSWSTPRKTYLKNKSRPTRFFNAYKMKKKISLFYIYLIHFHFSYIFY